jgi:hypothetical protein
MLRPTTVALPPGLIAGRHVVVAFPQPDRAVDELPDDVGLAGVPVGLGDHVHQDLLQRDLAPLPRPPRHLADGIQRQRVDRGIRVRPDTVVQTNELFPRQSPIGMRKGRAAVCPGARGSLGSAGAALGLLRLAQRQRCSSA